MMDALDRMLSVQIPQLMDSLPTELRDQPTGFGGAHQIGGGTKQMNAMNTNMPSVPTPKTHRASEVNLKPPPAPVSEQAAAPAPEPEGANPFAEEEEEEEDDSNPFGRPTEEDDEPWELQDEKDLKWDDLFEQAGAVGGKLAAGPARKALMATGVATNKLRHIWDLSDMDKDGSLDAEEFTVAMHLCELVNSGEEAPEVLEDSKVPKSKRKK
jgi:hypothetical protein